MVEPARRISLSYDDYLALERETELRHEYLDGEAWAMAGGTIRHADIGGTLFAWLWNALRGQPCRPHNSDLKIRVPATGLTTYPDASVICGPAVVQPGFADAAINPVLLAEVLSDSTESWDRGGKFAHYRRLPTLHHYLLVSQEPRRVELFTRGDDDEWMLKEYGPGETVPLAALGLQLPVDDLYADLTQTTPG